MARQTVSKEPSFGRDANNSRRSSLSSMSNPNVFSDDYAVDPTESDDVITPVDSISDAPEHLSLGRPENTSRNQTRSIPVPALPIHFSSTDRPSSISKRPLPGDPHVLPRRAPSSRSQLDVGTQRSFSTSSRFSIPRPESPYNGPTAPSQPYAMYPQVTRASSIASESTVRASERNFIPQAGPEHPYAMYTQNTVPEEEDSAATSTAIPLGFPGLGQSYRGGSNSSSNDIGDIVGTDGHIEQLPPYSRYADNVIAKGDMANIDPPTMSVVDEPTTPPDSGMGLSDSAYELNPTGSRENNDEVARKEGWVEKCKNRKCCGLPLWTVLLIGGVVFIATAIGGVIGGVVGNRRGVDQTIASAASTTTVWLDADPVATGPATPTCPTGHYSVSLNKTQEIDTCILNSAYNNAWGCMNTAALGISVFDTGSRTPLQVKFDDYSLRPQLFQYGPQPPDFNGTIFTLQPYKDREDDALGVAMFFSALFDKLIILPPNALSSTSKKKKRTVAADHVRRWGPSGRYLAVGDEPWYCFWNSTINEFWIFLDQDVNPPAATAAGSLSNSITTSPSGSATYSATLPGTAPPVASKTSPNTQSTSASSAYPTWTGTKNKRDFPDLSGSPEFPKLIKMVEKRKPNSNVQPYCQQMQVLNNWQIMPIPNIPTVCVEESEFAPPSRRAEKKWLQSRYLTERDTTAQLESNCICEWFSV